MGGESCSRKTPEEPFCDCSVARLCLILCDTRPPARPHGLHGPHRVLLGHNSIVSKP